MYAPYSFLSGFALYIRQIVLKFPIFSNLYQVEEFAPKIRQVIDWCASFSSLAMYRRGIFGD